MEDVLPPPSTPLLPDGSATPIASESPEKKQELLKEIFNNIVVKVAEDLKIVENQSNKTLEEISFGPLGEKSLLIALTVMDLAWFCFNFYSNLNQFIIQSPGVANCLPTFMNTYAFGPVCRLALAIKSLIGNDRAFERFIRSDYFLSFVVCRSVLKLSLDPVFKKALALTILEFPQSISAYFKLIVKTQCVIFSQYISVLSSRYSLKTHFFFEIFSQGLKVIGDYSQLSILQAKTHELYFRCLEKERQLPKYQRGDYKEAFECLNNALKTNFAISKIKTFFQAMNQV